MEGEREIIMHTHPALHPLSPEFLAYPPPCPTPPSQSSPSASPSPEGAFPYPFAIPSKLLHPENPVCSLPLHSPALWLPPPAMLRSAPSGPARSARERESQSTTFHLCETNMRALTCASARIKWMCARKCACVRSRVHILRAKDTSTHTSCFRLLTCIMPAAPCTLAHDHKVRTLRVVVTMCAHFVQVRMHMSKAYSHHCFLHGLPERDTRGAPPCPAKQSKEASVRGGKVKHHHPKTENGNLAKQHIHIKY